MRSIVTVTMFMVLWLLAGVTAAAADPPGPTDYLSEVIEIDPEVPGISIEIVGGDSFVVLVVEPGVSVDVVGYSGEPYLRYLPDGTVEENQLSPSRYLNEDRYAAAEVPAEAVAGAEPQWKVVATDGSYAWHDHRTHWMSSIKPPGRSPGDEVAEGVIPLFVDGLEVDVTVASVWQDPPSALPVVLGVTVGLLVAFAAIRKREQIITAIVITASTAATIVGAAAFFSMPSETGPPWSLWALPATALVVGLVAAARRGTMTAGSYRTLQMLGALELVLWGVLHWSWLWPALLPTRLPFWLDRFVGAGVLVGGIGAAIAVVLVATTPGRRVSFRA